MRFFSRYESPIGSIIICSQNGLISNLCFGKRFEFDDFAEREDDVIFSCKNQLDEYFLGKRKVFSIPIMQKGTAFQQSVWNTVRDIPYGEVCSYKEIAVKIGNANACRAVGNANNKNPILILVPCHRVISNSGNLVGYSAGIEIKKFLLEHEAKYK